LAHLAVPRGGRLVAAADRRADREPRPGGAGGLAGRTDAGRPTRPASSGRNSGRFDPRLRPAGQRNALVAFRCGRERSENGPGSPRRLAGSARRMSARPSRPLLRLLRESVRRLRTGLLPGPDGTGERGHGSGLGRCTRRLDARSGRCPIHGVLEQRKPSIRPAMPENRRRARSRAELDFDPSAEHRRHRRRALPGHGLGARGKRPWLCRLVSASWQLAEPHAPIAHAAGRRRNVRVETSGVGVHRTDRRGSAEPGDRASRHGDCLVRQRAAPAAERGSIHVSVGSPESIALDHRRAPAEWPAADSGVPVAARRAVVQMVHAGTTSLQQSWTPVDLRVLRARHRGRLDTQSLQVIGSDGPLRHLVLGDQLLFETKLAPRSVQTCHVYFSGSAASDPPRALGSKSTNRAATDWANAV
jgi:hypothetical protein